MVNRVFQADIKILKNLEKMRVLLIALCPRFSHSFSLREKGPIHVLILKKKAWGV